MRAMLFHFYKQKMNPAYCRRKWWAAKRLSPTPEICDVPLAAAEKAGP
jgi:hypothetical protein